MSVEYWVCAGVTLISAAVSFGFSVAGLRVSNGDAREPSLYGFARSAALLVVAIVAIFVASIPFVAAIAIAMIVVQAIDAGVGVIQRDRMKTIGPAITAVLNAAALVWLLVA